MPGPGGDHWQNSTIKTPLHFPARFFKPHLAYGVMGLNLALVLTIAGFLDEGFLIRGFLE